MKDEETPGLDVGEPGVCDGPAEAACHRRRVEIGVGLGDAPELIVPQVRMHRRRHVGGA